MRSAQLNDTTPAGGGAIAGSGYGPRLHPGHAEMLRASAISPEVARARGYETVSDPKPLLAAGFSKSQWAGPGILCPRFNLRGEPAGFLYRPDAPKGKAKYLAPRGQANLLDCHPTMADRLRSAHEVVFVVEGMRKADSLATIGVPALDIGGVFSWRGRNPQGGLTALGDWEDLNVKGSRFVLGFDSDIMVKQPVHNALSRLKRFLEGRGAASVGVLVLPQLGGTKTGLDDYIAATGAGPQELAALVLPDLPTFIAIPRVDPPARPPTNGASPTAEGPGLLAHPFTDLGNAERLVALHGEDIRYCHPWAKWLAWAGTRWEPDNAGRLMALAAETVRALYAAAGRLAQGAADMSDLQERRLAADQAAGALAWARKSEARPRLEAMVALARSLPGVPVLPTELDRDPFALNTPTGTVDLRDGSLRPHRREDLLTKLTAAAYAPEAQQQHPLWDEFLQDAILDQAVREYAQVAVGRSLIGQAGVDLILLLHGPGGTGKSTFLEAVRESLGDYAASVLLETFTQKANSHGPQPDLARLQGIRFVAIPEAGDGGGTVGLLKALTGADRIPTRSHYQETFEFRASFTVWLRSNSRPRVPADDSGLWRRLRELPFRHVFARPDPSVRLRLLQPEDAGRAVLAWAVHGAVRFGQEGLGALPPAVVVATATYRSDMDPLAGWLDERVVVEVAGVLSSGGLLFKNYGEWAEDQGIRRPLGRKAFSQRLADLGFPAEKSGSTRGHRGIRLRSLDDVATPGVDPTARYEWDTSKCPCRYEAHVGENSRVDIGLDVGTSVPSVPSVQEEGAGPSATPHCRCEHPVGRAELGGALCPRCGRAWRCPACGGCRRCRSLAHPSEEVES